jgi:hypothetical protein
MPHNSLISQMAEEHKQTVERILLLTLGAFSLWEGAFVTICMYQGKDILKGSAHVAGSTYKGGSVGGYAWGIALVVAGVFSYG